MTSLNVVDYFKLNRPSDSYATMKDWHDAQEIQSGDEVRDWYLTATGLTSGNIGDLQYHYWRYTAAETWPNSFRVNPCISTSAASGAWTVAAGTAYVGLARLRNEGAVGNWAEFSVAMAAGTWTLRCVYTTTATSPILAVKLDGTTLASIDTYSTPTAYNVVTDIPAVSVATSGIHTLRVQVTGKHASSSDYYCYLTPFSGVRTGA